MRQKWTPSTRKGCGENWCAFCPASDIGPHAFPADAKTNIPAVPFGKLPPTGRSMAMQSGAAEPTVWEKAEALLAQSKKEYDPAERCGYEKFLKKRNRPWNYFIPISKPMGEVLVIEDNLSPLTRWNVNYTWMDRGFYPCCDPQNPAGSGSAKVIRKDGYLYPLDLRKPNPCPPECQYCDESSRCQNCSPRPPPRSVCPRDAKDKCAAKKYGGDKLRAPLYRQRNEEM